MKKTSIPENYAAHNKPLRVLKNVYLFPVTCPIIFHTSYNSFYDIYPFVRLSMWASRKGRICTKCEDPLKGLCHRFFPHLMFADGDSDNPSFKHSPMWHHVAWVFGIALEFPITFSFIGHLMQNLHRCSIHLRMMGCFSILRRWRWQISIWILALNVGAAWWWWYFL